MSAPIRALRCEIEVDISPSLRERLLRQGFDLAFLLGPIERAEDPVAPAELVPIGFFAGSPKRGCPARGRAARRSRNSRS